MMSMQRVELDESSTAFVLAQVALLNCRVAGMQAENQHRIACGHSCAYGADEFAAVEEEFSAMIGYNAIMNMARP